MWEMADNALDIPETIWLLCEHSQIAYYNEQLLLIIFGDWTSSLESDQMTAYLSIFMRHSQIPYQS